MEKIKFGNITIAKDMPAVIIAEIACQHEGSMEKAKMLVDAAKASGADIAKFQLHVPEAEMVADTIHFWGGSMDEILEKSKFGTAAEHKEIQEYCKKIGIQYLCTPFSKEASDILAEVGVEAYKTGSGELTNLPMLRHMAKKKKPMIVSTGMSKLEEIADAVSVLKEEGVPFVLTHCLSEYPSEYEHMNLSLMKELEDKHDVMVGLSDHSVEIYSAIAAIALGAKVIEKHFTIPEVKGPDDIVSLKPQQFKIMVDVIRKVEKAMGNKKEISAVEQKTRDWAHHSVVALVDIAEGEEITSKNTCAKRPGTGIPASYLDKLYSNKLFGKKSKKELKRNTIIHWEDLN